MEASPIVFRPGGHSSQVSARARPESPSTPRSESRARAAAEFEALSSIKYFVDVVCHGPTDFALRRHSSVARRSAVVIVLAIGKTEPKAVPRVEPVAQRGSGGALDKNDGPVADNCSRSEAPPGIYDQGEGCAEREESSEESSRMSDEIAENSAEDAGDKHCTPITEVDHRRCPAWRRPCCGSGGDRGGGENEARERVVDVEVVGDEIADVGCAGSEYDDGGPKEGFGLRAVLEIGVDEDHAHDHRKEE